MIKNVGFIGLGVMGYNIALHIINANKNDKGINLGATPNKFNIEY